MAVALNVDLFDDDGQVIVRLVFFGETEEDAEEKRDSHMQKCPEFRRADTQDRTREFTEEIDAAEIPSEDDYEEEEEEGDEGGE
jgi:hypothetical protein